MLNYSQVERMHRNVETFADRIRDFESSLTTFQSRRRPLSAKPAVGPLNGRELAILRLIARGDDNGDIARSMHFALGTIKLHVRDILEKLDVSSRTEAAVQGVRRGLI